MPSKEHLGIIKTILLGVVGALIGGVISMALGYGKVDGFNLYSILISTAGAILFLFVVHKVTALKQLFLKGKQIGLLDTVLGLVGLNDKSSLEIKGVLEWIAQQGGIHAIVDHLQAGEFSAIAKSWLSDDENVAISSDIVQKMFSTEAVQQLASNVGVTSQNALELLAKYLRPAGQ